MHPEQSGIERNNVITVPQKEESVRHFLSSFLFFIGLSPSPMNNVLICIYYILRTVVYHISELYIYIDR